MKCSVKDFLSKYEEVLDGKLHFMCCESLRGKESVFKKEKEKNSYLKKKRIFIALWSFFSFNITMILASKSFMLFIASNKFQITFLLNY